MKTKQKGLSALLVVLIVAAVALVGAGAYVYVTRIANPHPAPVPQKNIQNSNISPGQTNNQSASQTASQTTVDATANWLTYSNSEWGIEMKYPQSWKLQGSEIHDPNSSAYIAISQLENPKNLSFEEWWQENTIVGGRPTILASYEDIAINGNKARIGYMPADKSGWNIIISGDQNNIYSLTAEGPVSTKPIFDQILSTFKFVEPQAAQSKITPSADDTTNWLVYEDKTLGLRFKYPAGWGPLHAYEDDFYETIAQDSRTVMYNIDFAGKRNRISGFLHNFGFYPEAENSWTNLDQPATSGVVMSSDETAEGPIFFREKITVAGQKTALTTELFYLPEGGGISINSYAKIIGLKGKYKFISLDNTGSYADMEKRLNKYYDVDAEKLNKNAIIELNALKNGATTDQKALSEYKTFKLWLSTFEPIDSGK